MHCRIHRALVRTLGLVLILAPLALAPAPARAQAEGISYSLIPTYDVLRWDKNLGMEDTELWGGKLGINFGQMISLQGYYLTRNNVNTDLGATGLNPGQTILVRNRALDVSRYGGDLVLNLGSGNLVPYLKGGGGIIRFDPDHGDAVRQIALDAGGGLRLGLQRLQLNLFVEDTAFRLDRYDLFDPALGPYPADPEDDQVRHNLSFGAGVNFFLGGYRGSDLSESDRAIMERYRHGLSGLSLPIEPFVGRLSYNHALDLDDQDVVGARTGLDFGRYFGLRGYYWRGVNDGFDRFEDVQSYGGEARFNLNSGQGAVPYLLAGVGQLDFRPDFRDRADSTRSDRTMLIAGAGMALTLSDRLVLNVAARDYVFSNQDLEDVTKPDRLYSNWVVSAGLQFAIGGTSPSGQKPLFGGGGEPAPAPAPAPAPESATAEASSAQTPEAASESTSAASGESAAPAAGTEKGAGQESTPATQAPAAKGKEAAPAPSAGNYNGERVIQIPVPTEGEIYIRYGKPGGVSIESRNVSGQEGAPAPAAGNAPERSEAAPTLDREALREAIRQELDRAGITGREQMTPEQEAALIEQRLSQDLDRKIDQRLRALNAAQNGGAPSTVVVTGGEGESATVSGGSGETRVETGGYHYGFRGLQPYLGWNVDSPDQAVFGGRVDLGGVTEHSSIRFLPELALGFGSDVTTFLLAADFQYDLTHLGDSDSPWVPYLGLGAGIFTVSNGHTDTDLAVNISYGVAHPIGPVTAFAEHQGIQAFGKNRILFGLRITR